MNHDPALYDAFARYGSGVTLVTARDGNRDGFLIAASVLTASVRPFTLAVSIGQDRHALPAILSDATWTLSVLGAQHLDLVRELTGPTTPEQRLSALAEAGAEPSEDGPLWLPDALATFWCTTHSTTKVHDQALVIGQVDRGATQEEGQPLLRWNRGFHTTTQATGDTESID